jgi:hypothetical protein
VVEKGVARDVVVTLPKGEASSGMATMFADYLMQNFEDFPSKRKLLHYRLLPMVLAASDRKAAITLRFGNGFVSVEDGRSFAPLEYSAPFLVLSKVASAQPLDVEELRQLRIRGALRHPVATLLGALLLRTPASLYDDGNQRRA